MKCLFLLLLWIHSTLKCWVISCGSCTALWSYCGCALVLPYMLKQLLSSNLSDILKPGCPRNVGSGETSLLWLYSQSCAVGPSARWRIKDTKCEVWGHENHSKWPSPLRIPDHQSWEYYWLTEAAAAAIEALWKMEGQKLGNRSRLGETGTLAQSLSHLVTPSLFFL